MLVSYHNSSIMESPGTKPVTSYTLPMPTLTARPSRRQPTKASDQAAIRAITAAALARRRRPDGTLIPDPDGTAYLMAWHDYHGAKTISLAELLAE